MGLALRPLFHGNTSDICAASVRENRLPVLRKVHTQLPSKVTFGARHLGRPHNSLVIEAVSVLEPQHFVETTGAVEQDCELHLDSKSSSQKLPSETDEMEEKERLRRNRISKANKGNVPWNKGRKHSAETLQRIRERTKLAMQDPKVKMKLANLGHAQSEATRKKIGVGVRQGWERRRQLLRVQETCHLEWHSLIAEASRKGYAVEVELQWDSYNILNQQLEQEWLESIEERKSSPRPKGSKRAPKSLEQRRKISQAITAKWADPEYRERVCSALAKYHGIPPGAERKPRRKPSNATLSDRPKPPKKKVVKQSNSRTETRTTRARQIRKLTPSFKDPLAESKLQMIKQIRERRAAMETKKREATEKAKLLTAQAEKAAKTLEAMVMKSSLAQASLLETRKLIAEANQWIQNIETGQFRFNEDINDTFFTANGSKNQSEEDQATNANAILHNGQIDGTHSELDNGLTNGAHLYCSSTDNYTDSSFDNCALKKLINGKENISVSSDGEGIRDHSFNYVLPPLQLNGTLPMKGNLLIPNESAKFGEEKVKVKMSSNVKTSSAAKTKKWVCGRLVEVEEN